MEREGSFQSSVVDATGVVGRSSDSRVARLCICSLLDPACQRRTQELQIRPMRDAQLRTVASRPRGGKAGPNRAVSSYRDCSVVLPPRSSVVLFQPVQRMEYVLHQFRDGLVVVRIPRRHTSRSVTGSFQLPFARAVCTAFLRLPIPVPAAGTIIRPSPRR